MSSDKNFHGSTGIIGYIYVSVAIIVVGPKDFPIMIRKVGSWIGSVKRYVYNVQSQVTEITDISNDDEDINKSNVKKNDNIIKKEDNNE